MKNTLKLCMIGLMVLAGIAVLSCTDGEFVGTGGTGNLNIVGIPAAYNRKYCEVSATGTGGSYTFNTALPRVRINGGKVKAPLYNGETIYTGSYNLSVTVTVYDDASTPTVTTSVDGTKNLGSVKFYSGSGVVDWK